LRRLLVLETGWQGAYGFVPSTTTRTFKCLSYLAFTELLLECSLSIIRLLTSMPSMAEGIIEIATSRIIGGSLPLGARSLVQQWGDLHRNELFEQWELARQAQPLGKIEPLP